MNRRSPLLALVAAGCGGGRVSAPAPEIAHHATRGALTAAPELDLEAGARMWRAIAPTGADYEQKLLALPDELKRPMAVALLRQGDFACNAYEEESGCAESYYVLDPLEPTATVDDPCLRRYLALWSLEQLEPEDVDALGETLVDLASMPSPEDELPRAVFALATDDAMRMRMLAVTSPYIADEMVGELGTDAARIHALVDLHLTGALAGLDTSANHDLLRPALTDDELPSWTKSELLPGFADDKDPRTTKALRALTADDDCDLAMTAAQLLADRGDPSFLPVRPSGTNPEAHLRAMCLLAAGERTDDPAWDAWLAQGYDSTTATANGYYDEDDNYVTDEPEHESIPADEATYDDRLAYGPWTCDDLTCTSGGWRDVTVTFAPATDGSLVVTAISSEEYGGYDDECGC